MGIAAKPFEVAITDALLADMRARIRNARWSEDFGNADWRYGVEGSWLRAMVDYWADGFDWRAQEAAINAVPNFIVTIDGVTVHFLHIAGTGKNPIPLLLTHGWPWTFWDYRAVIGPLTDPAAHGAPGAQSFSLIIPSLPGFGFSSPLRRAVTVADIVHLWTKLMTQVLGYGRFMAGGGDFGAFVTSHLAHAYPDLVRGAYIMFPNVPGIVPGSSLPADFAPEEQWMVEENKLASGKLASHMTVHQHDPQTLAYALADSPIGCAAWLWERRRAWSDCGGDVLSAFTRDELCTLASIYWLTNTIGTSMRLYWDQNDQGFASIIDPTRQPVIAVPTGYAVFPKENIHMPRRVIEEHVNLRHYSVMPRGGHFGVAEQPQLVVDDLRAFAQCCE